MFLGSRIRSNLMKGVNCDQRGSKKNRKVVQQPQQSRAILMKGTGCNRRGSKKNGKVVQQPQQSTYLNEEVCKKVVWPYMVTCTNDNATYRPAELDGRRLVVPIAVKKVKIFKKWQEDKPILGCLDGSNPLQGDSAPLFVSFVYHLMFLSFVCIDV